MKRYSVFVLCVVLFCCSCGSDREWTMNALAGTYVLAAKEKPVMEELLESDKVSGQNYDDPCIVKLELNEDATYEQSCDGGGFESVGYRGRWTISNDSIFLEPLECIGAAVGPYSQPDKDVLLIRSAGKLEVLILPGTEEGRYLLRR